MAVDSNTSTNTNHKLPEKCFNQIFPVRYIKVKGWGNCFECKTDFKNKNCKGYRPFITGEFIVK